MVVHLLDMERRVQKPKKIAEMFFDSQFYMVSKLTNGECIQNVSAIRYHLK